VRCHGREHLVQHDGVVAALSVTTSTGVTLAAPMDYWNPRAAVASRRGETNTDDLAELVDRAVDVAPLPGDLHVGPVDLPAVTDCMPAGPSGLGQQQRESLDPAVDGGVVDLDPAFGEQFFDVAVGDRETQILKRVARGSVRNPGMRVGR